MCDGNDDGDDDEDNDYQNQCKSSTSLKRALEGFTLFVKHTFFLCRFPKLGFCCSSFLAAALHSGQSLEIRSLMNWYLLSFNLCINSVRSSRT